MHNLEISRAQATKLVVADYVEVSVNSVDTYRALELVKLIVPGDENHIYGKVFCINAPNRITLRHVATMHAEG